MQCPDCSAANPHGKRFCANCGAPLPLRCHACGAETSPGARFCGDCGASLNTAVSPVTEPSPTSSALEAERRQVTVVFCDLVGSTALAERLDPEELRELLAQYQESCGEVIQRFEGHIARYVGDGLLIYFGFPTAHEDDPSRAVRSGLGIVESIHELNARIRNPGDLAVRIGIATGMVVVGDVGRGERREQNAIIGETPNLAARLQALAAPDMVVISESTRRLVAGMFDCDDLGEHDLKGISQSVRAYHVRGESGAPSHFEAVAQEGLTPLVGREEEIGLLLKRWEQAKENEGQVVLLSAEAGAGKSRIVRAFREHLGEEPHSRILYYCSPYHQHSAFYPAIEQFNRALRFDQNDSPDQKLEKLDHALTDLGLPVDQLGPVLATFFSLPASGRYPPLALSPEEHKRRSLEAMLSVIEAMAVRNPVLMVVEDAQWMDPSTLELVTLLIDQLRSRRFLILVTFRPEFTPPWSGSAHVSALTLNRLSQKDCVSLIMKVTGGKDLPPDVLEQIVAKTDGVPLFVEELTKNLLESGLFEERDGTLQLTGPLPELAIPASLQDSLMARLDRLIADTRRLAQLASALGRLFSHELLAAVTFDREEALNAALTQLVAAGLIYRHGVAPAIAYEFKHALVQDAAYQSLLKRTRREYHQRIATVLEERFPQVARGQPELLAHHYTEAQLSEQAIDYWKRAATQASERAGYVEALADLAKGLDLIQSLPRTPERTCEELDIHLRQAEALHFLGRRQEIVDLLQQNQEHLERFGNPSLAAHFYFWLGWAHAWLGHRSEAAEYLSRSLSEATRSGDEALMGKVHRALALECTYSGSPLEEAVAHARQAVALLEGTADYFWLSQALYALSYCCYYVGDFDEALGAATRLDALGESIGSRRARAESAMGGLVLATRGDWAAGIDACEGALALSPDLFETAFVMACLGKACSEAGDMARAVDTLQQAIQLADQVRSRQWCAYFRTWLGEAYLRNGRLDEAHDLLTRTLAVCMALNFGMGIGWCHHLLGRVLQARGELSSTQLHLDNAVRTFRTIGAKFELGRTYLARAELSSAQGDDEGAGSYLTEAHHLFDILQLPKYVEQTEQLSHTLGVGPTSGT